MIKKLNVKNFKSLKELEITCKRINVFIGEPNSGKSNILESLGFLSFLGGYAIELKNFVRMLQIIDLFYDLNIREKIFIELDEKKIIAEYRNGNLFLNISPSPKEKNINLNLYPPFTHHKISPEVKEIFKNIKFFKFLFRENFPSQQADFFLPSGENLLIVLETNPELRKIIGNILLNFNLILNLKRLENRITLAKRIEETIVSEVPYFLLSDTIQRLIYYISAVETNENSVLILEEPEAHAFPYYTKYLAEIIAEDKKNQYFISTHNPYFLSSIIEKSKKEDVKILITYIEKGQTKVKEFENDKIEHLLEYEFVDIFFNIDKLIQT
ncbi:MAG TPA: AAA family ATPase [bacterium]|nr:AAA family ATPase [bacterium]